MRSVIQASLLVVLLTVTGQAAAVNYELCAGVTTKSMPDNQVVTLWGYGLDIVGEECAPTIPGPTLTIPPGDTTLAITLRNELPEPVSIVIAGLSLPSGSVPVTFVDLKGRTRVRSFTKETASNAAEVYTFNDIKPGTYLYSSGTHPAVQVQMGLYGAATKDFAAGQAYSGILYNEEVTLLYSEIDPALHAAVANGTYGTSAYPSTINYAPRYFLVNGDPYGGASLLAGQSGNRTLIRLLNAGLENHSIVLQGQHLSAIAEDGNLYPYPREQYALLMAAGKTRDAIFEPTVNGSFPVYDRRLRIGMFSNLVTGADLLAVNDPESTAGATINEDASSTSVDVLANDVATNGIDITSVSIVRQPSHGVASVSVSGAVDYVPNLNFHGSDDLTYKFNDSLANTSNLATVSLLVRSVNDAPVAVADSYVVEAASSGNRLNVLLNDSDADGDTLSLGGPQAIVSSNGARILKIGTTQFSYSAPAGYTGTDTFNYVLSDGTLTASGSVSVAVGTVAVETPTIEAPIPNATLNGTSEVFTWAANDTQVDQWWVYAGNAPRTKTYFDSGNLSSATNATVIGLPSDGSLVYITLWFRQVGGSWRTVVETYTASGGP